MNSIPRLRQAVPEPLKPPLRGLRASFRALRALKYRGDSFYCPFCDGRFSRTLPMGLDLPVLREYAVVGGSRRDGACPRCESFDRERMFVLYLSRCTDVFERPIRLLHVAPEAHLERVIRGQCSIDYLSADLNAPGVMMKLDITRIQMPDDQFDVIICSHVLEHIPDDRRAMSELQRVLRPGGWAILQVPFSLNLEETFEDSAVTEPRARERMFGQRDHVRIYALHDYVRRLEASGFRVELVDMREALGEEAVRRHGLNPEEPLCIGRKD